MTEYIITQEQISELNKAHGGMKIVTSWLSCYAIWDTSFSPPLMKSEHLAITLPNVVRCRDCKHGVDGGLWCKHFANYGDLPTVQPDGFCAWGERREDG